MIALVKAVHIAALLLWCAGLIALPLMLSRHRRRESQMHYSRLRLLTHDSFSFIVTPAAVIAIAAGTLLIWLRQAFEPWMYAKLAAVGLLVCLHAFIGHVVVETSERRGGYLPPPAAPLLLAILLVISVILLLVLDKPRIENIAPDWLRTPLGRQLPEVPI